MILAPLVAGQALVSQAKPKKAAAAEPAAIKKNSAKVPSFPDCGTVEYGGRTYHTVMIGRQCWLRENLAIGQTIAANLEAKDNAVTEKYAPGNDAALLPEYGGLYPWREYGGYDMTKMAPPVQGICPPGFHIPSETEWYSLISFLGGEGLAGGKLKEAGFSYWNEPNSGASNESGFSARGAGIRNADGTMTLFRAGGLVLDRFHVFIRGKGPLPGLAQRLQRRGVEDRRLDHGHLGALPEITGGCRPALALRPDAARGARPAG